MMLDAVAMILFVFLAMNCASKKNVESKNEKNKPKKEAKKAEEKKPEEAKKPEEEKKPEDEKKPDEEKKPEEGDEKKDEEKKQASIKKSTKSSKIKELFISDRTSIAFQPEKEGTKSVKITSVSEKTIAVKINVSDPRISVEPSSALIESKKTLELKVTRKPKTPKDEAKEDYVTMMAVETEEASAEDAFKEDQKDAFKKKVTCTLSADKAAEGAKNVATLSQRGKNVKERLCSVDKERLVFTEKETTKTFTIINSAAKTVHYLFELSNGDAFKVSHETLELASKADQEVTVTVKTKSEKEEKIDIFCVLASGDKAGIAKTIRAIPEENRYTKTILLVNE